MRTHAATRSSRCGRRPLTPAPTPTPTPTPTADPNPNPTLSQGWDFVFDPEIEEAGLFVKRMRKWEEGIGGEKKAVLEWDLEGEAQPFVGENKHD